MYIVHNLYEIRKTDKRKFLWTARMVATFPFISYSFDPSKVLNTLALCKGLNFLATSEPRSKSR